MVFEVCFLLNAFSFLVSTPFIFGLFLLVNLLVGIWAAQGVNSLRAYSIGDKNFSTGALTATIVATWIGGSFMSFNLAHIYTDGWYFIFPLIGDSLTLLLTGLFLAPRMGEFLNNLSVAEAMGNLYGKAVRIITAIAGILVSIGAVAIQFKVSAKVIALVFDMNDTYATLAAAIIVITYSAMGGIRAVTFTDIVQFFTFAAFIPLLALVIWNGIQNPTAVIENLQASPQFDLQALFHAPTRMIGSLLLMLFYVIPAFVPTVFQRVSMASNTQQVRRSFIYAFYLCLAITLFTIAIGVLLVGQGQPVDPHQIFRYILVTYTYPGLKELILMGTMAMVMSTADSHLNSAAVLLTHDLPQAFNWPLSNHLLLAKLLTFLLGGLALVLALYQTDLLDLTLMAWSFYMPIVSVPLLMAIGGFRSSPRAALIGMAAGGITVALWDLYLAGTGLNSVVPGMGANLLCLLASHYLLREEGGWTGIKNPSPLLAARQARRDTWRQLISQLKSTQLYAYFQQNLPSNELIYVLLGIYVMGATYALFFTIPPAAVLHYQGLYGFITHSVLLLTAMFLTYPAWPATFKAKWFITWAWPLGICYVLFVVGTILVIMSGFHPVQSMIFLLNLVIAALLLAWPLMVFLAGLGVGVGYLVFTTYYGSIHLTGVMDAGQFKLIYAILLVSSLLITRST